MKRSLGDASTRSTAGYLPVPLFNQKKRNRQPLTSNPLKNEPGASSGTRTYDFSPTSFGWGTADMEVTELQKAANNGQTEYQMAPSLMKPANASKANLASIGKSVYACRQKTMNVSNKCLHRQRGMEVERISLYNEGEEEKSPSTKVWNRNKYAPLSNAADSRSNTGIIRKSESHSNSVKTVQHQKTPGNHNPSQHIKTETSQTYTSREQWPVKPNSVSRSLQDYSLAYKFNQNTQENKMNEKQFDCVPEDKSQEVASAQLKIKEKKNSLRIISAVIESMRHWSQYAYKTALLFEVLGTLDSAVTPGAYGAKNFLLRDGKESLSCVFYEIDRDLPRLIRGRVHRCMGNYDAKRNIFKCVSVRPATVQEQNTFQEFVKIADIDMTAYVKTMKEI